MSTSGSACASGFGEQSRWIIELPVPHDVLDIAERRDVVEWVAAEEQEVGAFAWFYRPNVVAPERLSGARRRGADNVHV